MSERRNSESVTTDATAIVPRRDLDYIFRYKPPRSGSRILDCGCEGGDRTLAIYRWGCRNATGIDASAHNIAIARQRARKQRAAITFVESSPWSTPFPQKCFGVIFLLGSLFGQGRNQREDVELLVEMRRLLASNGTLWLNIADADGLRQRHGRQAGHQDAVPGSADTRSNPDAGRPLLYDRRQITALLHLLGFEAISLHSLQAAPGGPEASRLLIHCLAPSRR